MGPCAGVDYNLTLCPLQSLHSNTFTMGNYARVDLNPMLYRVDFIHPSQGLRIWPQRT
jgi:hypothetical protein